MTTRMRSTHEHDEDETGPVEAQLGPGDLDLERLASWLGPLASATRLKLLRHLTQPHYLEEVATHLGITRQGARKHLTQLVDIGLLERRAGVRDTMPVIEYVLAPQTLFLIYDEFEKLANLRSEKPAGEALNLTLSGSRARRPTRLRDGPAVVILRGLGAGDSRPIDASGEKPWRLGRDARNDLVIPHDPYVSTRHAEIRVDGKALRLADLRSTNGTQHNWVAMEPGAEVELEHGDVIGVGRTLLLFWNKGA